MSDLRKLSAPLFAASGIAALAYAGICLSLYSYQANLIFRPLPFLLNTPAKAGLAYEDVWIPLRNTADKLHGWWIPHPKSRRVMLLCHGNYGNISYNIDRSHLYHSLGFSVLLFDYRGYGSSPKEPPSEQKTYEDAEAALRYLTVDRQIDPQRITALGHSLGGAIAIHLAAQHPELNSLIVECSFTSMREAVHAQKIYRLFPIDQLLTHAFDSLSKVKSLQIPVFYIHGEEDTDVPAKFSRQLFEASSTPKKLWIAAGAGHNNLTTDFKSAYTEATTSFLSQTEPTASIEH